MNNKNKKANKNKKIIKKEEVKDDLPSISQEEAIEQFELELCWCIQKLNLSLEKNKKLTPRQYEDGRKTLAKLSSKNAPLIQKRQLMRITFGDYRAEMAKEEKQHSKDALKIKFEDVKPNKKSQFFKRINKTEQSEESLLEHKEKEEFKFIKSDNSFRFDFATEN